MATDHKYTFNTHADGQVLSLPVLEIGSGEPFTDLARSPSADAILEADTAQWMSGGVSAKFGGIAGATARIGYQPSPGCRQFCFGTGFKLAALPGATNGPQTIHQVRGSAINGAVNIDTASKLSVNRGTSFLWAASAALTTGWYYVEDTWDFDLGKVQFRYYAVTPGDPPTYTLVETSPLFTGQDLGVIADLTVARAGRISTTGVLNGWMDILFLREGAFGLVGPVDDALANIRPTLTIIPSKSSFVEPGEAVSLAISASDTDGSIASVSVSQVGATNALPTGSGNTLRTVVGPYTVSGQTLSYKATATDDDGAVSLEATCTVAVLPCTETIVNPDGTESPIQMSVV